TFMDWIGEVIRYRRETAGPEDSNSRQRAMQYGILEAWRSGTRFAIDTITVPWDPNWVDATIGRMVSDDLLASGLVGIAPFSYQPCPEILDIQAIRRQQTLDFARDVHSSAPREWLDSRFAVSPHAPYTASVELVRQAVSECILNEGILSMHLGESRDEMDWLQHRSGPMEQRLAPYRDATFNSSIATLPEYLSEALKAPRALIIHGNHLDAHCLRQLADSSQRAAIVHCPRTYTHFHGKLEGRYPLEMRLSSGVRHLLGTDSRASNPDLNLWREVQHLAEQFPHISADTLVAMATSDAALFLGRNDLGTIEVGKRSLLTAFVWPECFECNENTLLPRLLHADRNPVPFELVLSSLGYEFQ
ncbi:MAG: amidohydrolase family protein, partial [Planctomycetes bacterium]|nr:amidohydrolase family protein [Planctomycetota bacterium]